jgi:D-sedoheptulose 7-phosphate isomerase
MSSQKTIQDYFSGHLSVLAAVQKRLEPEVQRAAEIIIESLGSGGKWILCGNGGSAADSQHLAAELVGRLYKMERRGLPALALTTDTSTLTAVANDYGFKRVFARQVEALARPGDVLMGLSTSGNSPDVLEALKLGRKMGCHTLGMTGASGGRMAPLCDVCLKVPSDKSFHIQEAHITLGHLICFLVEERLGTQA